MKTELEAPGANLLTRRHDTLFSSFAFTFKLCFCIEARLTHALFPAQLKSSVGGISASDPLDTEGLVTGVSRPGRSAGYFVGGIIALDGFDWSNGLRYHNLDTKPDTAFKHARGIKVWILGDAA